MVFLAAFSILERCVHSPFTFTGFSGAADVENDIDKLYLTLKDNVGFCLLFQAITKLIFYRSKSSWPYGCSIKVESHPFIWKHQHSLIQVFFI
jgi:hypothetical protein